jgi:hypothetical protein
LDKARKFLTFNVDKLTVTSSNSSSAAVGHSNTNTNSNTNSSNSSSIAGKSLWKWLQLADELRLSSSIPVLVNRAVTVDRAGCSNAANTKGLSATLQQLVSALATLAPPVLAVNPVAPAGCIRAHPACI